MSETKTTVVPFGEGNMTAIAKTPTSFAELVATIKQAIEETPQDVETKEGRKAIAALAYKIARTKTTLDDAAKKLGEEARQELTRLNGHRSTMTKELEQLQRDARAPLDRWEAAEAEREAKRTRTLEFLERAGDVAQGEKPAAIAERITKLEAFELDAIVLGDMAVSAANLKQRALDRLRDGHAAAIRHEAEQEELRQLRERQAEADRILAAQRAADEKAAREAEIERKVQERLAAQASAPAPQPISPPAPPPPVMPPPATPATPVVPPPRPTINAAPFSGSVSPAPASGMDAARRALVRELGMSDALAARTMAAIASGKIPGVVLVNMDFGTEA